MKNKILISLGFLLLLPMFQSCEKDEDVKMPVPYEATWQDEAYLKFTTSGADNTFVYNIEQGAGGQQYWNVTTVNFDVSLILGDFQVSEISKIDIYVFAEEKNGDNFKYLGGDQGKLYKTINNPTESFQMSVSKDDLADLFKNDFSASHNGDVSADDVFEFKWVIAGKDGSIVDTRTGCFGFNCTFSFGTKIIYVAPPVLEGTYNYEWIDATADALYWGGISIGQTGTISMTLQPGSYTIYDVSDLSCDYAYGGPGDIEFNYDTGLIKTIDPINSQVWTITDVNGPTITVDFSYKYSASYNEYGTFTLTRADGSDWPSNTHSN